VLLSTNRDTPRAERDANPPSFRSFLSFPSSGAPDSTTASFRQPLCHRAVTFSPQPQPRPNAFTPAARAMLHTPGTLVAAHFAAEAPPSTPVAITATPAAAWRSYRRRQEPSLLLAVPSSAIHAEVLPLPATARTPRREISPAHPRPRHRAMRHCSEERD